MQVTKGTWCMREQCVPGFLSSSPAQEPGNEARRTIAKQMSTCLYVIGETTYCTLPNDNMYLCYTVCQSTPSTDTISATF